MPLQELENNIIDEKEKVMDENTENDLNEKKKEDDKVKNNIINEVKNPEIINKPTNKKGLFKRFFQKVGSFFKKVGEVVSDIVYMAVYGKRVIALMDKNNATNNPEVTDELKADKTKEEKVDEISENNEIGTDFSIRDKMIKDSVNAPYFNFKPDEKGLQGFINATILDDYIYSVSNEKLTKEDYKENKKPDIIISIKNKNTHKDCGNIVINPDSLQVVKKDIKIKDDLIDVNKIQTAYWSYQAKNKNPNLLVGSINGNTNKYNDAVRDSILEIYKSTDECLQSLINNEIDSTQFNYKGSSFEVEPITNNDGTINECNVIVGEEKYSFSEMLINIGKDGELIIDEKMYKLADKVNELAEKHIKEEIDKFDPDINNDIITAFNQFSEKFNDKFEETQLNFVAAVEDDILFVSVNDMDNKPEIIQIHTKTANLLSEYNSPSEKVFSSIYKQLNRELNRGNIESNIKSSFEEQINALGNKDIDSIVFKYKNNEAHVNRIDNKLFISIYDKDNNEIMPTSKIGNNLLDDKVLYQIAGKLYDIHMESKYDNINEEFEKYAEMMAEKFLNPENELEEHIKEENEVTIDEMLEQIEEENANKDDVELSEEEKFVDSFDLGDI